MSFQAGRYRLGRNATLAVRTERAGAAAKAGHDLLIHVTVQEATLVVADDPGDTTMELTADATSLPRDRGHGGIQALGDEDVASIHQTIDDEVLDARTSASARRACRPTATRSAQGDLTIVGHTQPIEFDLVSGDAAAARQPSSRRPRSAPTYSALFGALKVKDEVQVVLEGHLEPQSR